MTGGGAGYKMPICFGEEEMIEHILWSCSSTNDIWGVGFIKLQKSKCVGKLFKTMFADILERCENHEIKLFVVTVRHLWLCRNAIFQGEKFTDPNQLIYEAHKETKVFQKANVVQKDYKQGTSNGADGPNVG
jgi:hypothetical protein